MAFIKYWFYSLQNEATAPARKTCYKFDTYNLKREQVANLLANCSVHCLHYMQYVMNLWAEFKHHRVSKCHFVKFSGKFLSSAGSVISISDELAARLACWCCWMKMKNIGKVCDMVNFIRGAGWTNKISQAFTLVALLVEVKNNSDRHFNTFHIHRNRQPLTNAVEWKKCKGHMFVQSKIRNSMLWEKKQLNIKQKQETVIELQK